MESVLMSSIVYFAFLTLVSYVFFVINLPILIIPSILLSLFLLKKPVLKAFKKTRFKLDRKTIITTIIFLIGIVGQLAIISPSGIKNKNGDLLFWSANGHDGAWHIALMEEMKKGYPFQNPVFAGEKLTNYHFFSDILPAVVSKYTPISDTYLYFHIFPIIYSLFLGISAYFLTKKLAKSHSASIWAVIFTYFTGSFGYLIGKGESVFWSTMPQSASGNPPQIISDFLILAGIYYVLKFKENKKYFWHSLLILGTISSFKIYAGVVILLSLSLVSIYEVIKHKKFGLLILTFFSGVLALVLYLPNSSHTGSFLIFEPWWYIRTMIVEPSRLNLLDWELRRQTYIYEHNLKRVIWLEGVGFLIFFFGNLGMRFLGLKQYFKTHPIIKVAILISLILPLLFLQKGVASNTAQFLQYFVLLFGILAGIQVSKITKRYNFLIPLIIILSIPTQLTLLKDFYSRPAFAKIPAEELEALDFIKKNTDKDAVILTPPYDKNLDTKEITPPIWDWFDTAYVSAYSGRRTYFDDYEQVDIMGYDYKNRDEIKKIIFESSNSKDILSIMNSSNFNVLYFPIALKPNLSLSDFGFTQIFSNSQTEVWKIEN